jgi:predicted permease
MKTLRRWMSRAAGLATRRRRETELTDEIESHIQLATDDNLRRGAAPDEARRAALLQLGSTEALKERYRDQRGVPFLEHVVQDLRYAGRSLRRSVGFTATAVITIAFGVFGPVVTFTMAKAWILEPLPFQHPEALLDVRRLETASGDLWSVNPADFLDFKRGTATLQDIAAYQMADARITGGARAERLRSAVVTANFFPLIGARTALGRVFASGDDANGAAPVVVISDALWRERFDSDPSIVGRTIRLNGLDRTIVGVMPKTFQFTLLGNVDVWQPLAFAPADALNRTRGGVRVIARLAPGRTVDQARDELTRLAQDLAAAHPDTNAKRSVHVVSLADEVRRHHDLGFIVPLMFAMVGCVLLIACANVTNVMLARTSARRREMAMRLALGASRTRIVQQWLVEHVLLFVVASAIGAVMSVYGADWITNSIPQESRQFLRNYAVLRVDGGVIAFALGLGVLCGILFGGIPAWTGAQADVNNDLRDASGRTTMGRGAARVRSALVVAEVALALALLIGSGLLVQSARNRSSVDLGFDTRRLLTFRTALDDKHYTTPAAINAFYDRLVANLAASPGVTAAAAGSLVPFSGVGISSELFIEGQPEPKPADTPWTAINKVTPGYAAAMGLRLRRGRFFEPGDGPDAGRVVVVNEALVARHFDGRDPLGLRLRFDRASKDSWTIVGVVGDVKNYEPTDRPEPQVYVPIAQNAPSLATVVVRTSGDPESLSGTVLAAVAALDPTEPVSRIFSMDALIGLVIKPFQTISTFVTFFGAVTLLLAGVGVYGVVAYTFAQRTREIGIRVALGARRLDVAWLVFRQLRMFLLAALLPGIGLAWGFSHAIEALLVGVKPTEWWLYLSMSALLAAVAFLGALVPARRATAIDPVTALRYD